MLIRVNMFGIEIRRIKQSVSADFYLTDGSKRSVAVSK